MSIQHIQYRELDQSVAKARIVHLRVRDAFSEALQQARDALRYGCHNRATRDFWVKRISLLADRLSRANLLTQADYDRIIGDYQVPRTW